MDGCFDPLPLHPSFHSPSSTFQKHTHHFYSTLSCKTPYSMDPTSPPTTPPLSSQSPAATTPTPLVVPKAFKYPEMYSSPTDSIMSPVSKGIFARNKSKKSSRPLRNSSTSEEQHKIEDYKLAALEI